MSKRPKMTPEQEKALALLLSYGSHAGIDREIADAITLPFGFKAHLHKEVVNKHPKGLWITGMKPGTKVERTGGWLLASGIASHLGLTYEPAFGRGTDFWRAIEAIRAHYGVSK